MSKKEKRVVYHEFADEHRIQIVEYLYKEHGWKPVLLSANNVEPIRKWADSKHKDCIIQNSIKLRQAQFDYSNLGTPVPIDAEIINALSEHEKNFFGALQDTTGWEYSFEERKLFYYDMLKFWNTFVCNFKPDLFVCFTWPHTSTEYAFYLLCKYYFKIDILFLDPVPFFDHKYNIIGTSLEKLYTPFIKIYESSESIEPGEDVTTYLSEVRCEKAVSAKFIRDVYKADKTYKWKLWKQFVLLILRFCIRGSKVIKDPQFDFKKNRKPYNQLVSRMNQLDNFLFLKKLRKQNIDLRKIYKKYCSRPDFDKNYLYFAAPYQPESVSSINGGCFEELLLSIDILSACLPVGWVIYYKEHPATFMEGHKGALKRNGWIYDRIKSYNNVFFVPVQTDTFKLIDHSRAVASVSGSASWEAVVRGKPALSFGSAWYMGCKSIFEVKTLKDAQAAMVKILNGFLPDHTDIERYAAAIEKVAVKGMIHLRFSDNIKKCNNPGYEMKRIAKALYEAYERHYLNYNKEPLRNSEEKGCTNCIIES